MMSRSAVLLDRAAGIIVVGLAIALAWRTHALGAHVPNA